MSFPQLEVSITTAAIMGPILEFFMAGHVPNIIVFWDEIMYYKVIKNKNNFKRKVSCKSKRLYYLYHGLPNCTQSLNII